ncbi:hypothetical protein DHEL01_v206036 [Diaporthe helianthi]|uniref:Rho-GAP domain-containing protein n=1 Tax=Diaporthe helianthi TaxID=158607 RepID=A0A2P5HZC0_DIAHE|nr:hypothetical protein DHEL01_v206036 [Diaporthe helianthi]
MGRKKSSNKSKTSATATTTTTTTYTATTLAQPQTQQRDRPSETDQQHQPRLSPAAAAHSSSPRSPRSPFTSRFSPKNLYPLSDSNPQLQNQNQNNQLHPNPLQDQSPAASPPVHPQSAASRAISAASTPRKPQHIAELQQQQPLHDPAPFPPITSSVTQPDDKPSSARPQQPDRRRLKSSHGQRPRHDDDDHNNNNNNNNNNKKGFFFSFTKSSKSSSDRPTLPPHSQPNTTTTTTTATATPAALDTRRDAVMRSTDQPTPTKHSPKQSTDASHVEPDPRPAPSLPSRSDSSLASSQEKPDTTTTTSSRKGSKPKPFTLLSRTKSQRDRDGRSPRHTPSPQDLKEAPYNNQVPLPEPERAHIAAPAKTAPVPIDRSYREAMSSSSRNQSADRGDRVPSRDASTSRNSNRERDHSRSQQHFSQKDGPASFFNNLKREGGRVAESIGKGLFGKGGRSGSTTEKEPVVDDEHYVLKVINLPLVEQTRLTRISKRLEDSRDKTEFWMPAFPWRAIDYLNYKGCDVEGLYRVPGSGPQIKKWQRRFDERHDVDLFNQEDLYDINIIGSMLKAWLRELPDELFPKEAQDRIARECAGADKVPQMLIDELSNLSPFNYYLLFAITCHLSLLLAHADKNKMDFRNLCICFQPCMKIDAFCFKFLVCDWRDCWKGCKNETKFIEEEYKLFDTPPPPGLGVRKRLEPRSEPRPERRPSPTVERDDRERNISSPDSSKKSQQGGDSTRLKKKNVAQENGTTAAKTAHLYTDAQTNGQIATPRASNDMRPLSPIKPLSPLGF